MLIILIIIVYLIGCVLSYGIALSYFEWLFSLPDIYKKDDTNTKKFAIIIALFSLLSIAAMITMKDFKYCGIKFKRSKNGSNKRN